MMNAEGRRLRALVAARTRISGPDHPDVVEYRRELRTARAAQYLHEVVSQQPPLLPAQVDRLVAVLR